jgi:hypothetical protein
MSDEQRSVSDIEAELSNIDTNTVDVDYGDQDDAQSEDAGPSQAAIDASNYEAGRKGWVPKNQYKKNPDTWVDAQTFLERGDRFVTNLQRDVAKLTQKLEDFEGTKAAFVKFSEDTIARKDVELKEAISALKIQRVQAIREGEDDLAVQLDDRIDLLKEQRNEVKAAPAVAAARKAEPDAQDPVLQEWIEEDNSWFNDEPKLRDFAIKVGEQMIADGETVRGRRFLDKVRSVMETEFPRRFKAKKEDATYKGGESSTAASGNKTGGVSGKTERDLPAVDLALMKEFIATGFTTKEKFLKSYFSRN